MELKPLFQNIASAIREKDGTKDPIVAASFPERILAIPSGQDGDGVLKDVNFYDYDGTLVHSFPLAEIQRLSSLPDGPKHDGLVFQGWNCSLEKIKALRRPMNVGAMYITSDGKTRLTILVANKARGNVPLYITQTVSNGVVIDWGDGSDTETLDGTGAVHSTHQYAAEGVYVISLSVIDGCKLGFGANSNKFCVMGDSSYYGRVYPNMLRGIRVGEGVTSIGTQAFYDCSSLGSVTIPEGVTSIGNSAFYNCYSLGSVTIPEGVTSIGNYAFRYCSSLGSVTIPEGVTSIGDSAFYSCSSLGSVTIPEGVTSIGTQAFNSCFGVAEYYMKSVLPPTLVDATVFEGISSDCVIYVPAGSLDAYKTAENWSVYADHMQEESK